jgi:S1-C subfamily serine protease
MNRRTSAGLTGLVIAASFGLASCSGFPTPPGGLPAGWVPSATPSPIPSEQADSPLGFTPEERAAVRVRAETCEFLVTGSGFILDDHTIVTSREVVDGYVNIEASLSDGTDLTVSGVTRGATGEFEFLTVREDLSPAVTLADSDPSRATDLISVGYPGFEPIVTAVGNAEDETTRHGDPSNFAYLVWMEGFYGQNGAPVFNLHGLLVGMFDMPYESEERSAYYPVSSLRALLDDPSLVTDHAPTTCS